MAGITAALAEFLGAVGQSFRLSALFPSLIFVGLNVFLAERYFPEQPLVQFATRSEAMLLASVGALALMVSYSLTILNHPLIQVYEGYAFRQTWIGRLLQQFQLRRKEALRAESQALAVQAAAVNSAVTALTDRDPPGPIHLRALWNARDRQIWVTSRSRQIETELAAGFPDDPEVLPTRLGNVFAAFEAYSRHHYNMQSVTLWPRLLPTLIKSGYADRVEREKMGFDFFLNLSFLALCLTGLWLIYSLYFDAVFPVLLVLTGGLLSWLFYRFAVLAAHGFGVTVRTSFDLHREALRTALGLETPRSFADERDQWEAVSDFLRDRWRYDDPSARATALTRGQVPPMAVPPDIPLPPQGDTHVAPPA